MLLLFTFFFFFEKLESISQYKLPHWRKAFGGIMVEEDSPFTVLMTCWTNWWHALFYHYHYYFVSNEQLKIVFHVLHSTADIYRPPLICDVVFLLGTGIRRGKHELSPTPTVYSIQFKARNSFFKMSQAFCFLVPKIWKYSFNAKPKKVLYSFCLYFNFGYP